MPRRKSPPALPSPVVHPFDVTYGTDTSGLLEARVIAQGTDAATKDLTAYYGIAPSIFQSAIDIWLQRTQPTHSIERYTFYDVGAGKGRALLLASEHPFRSIEGVELNAGLVEIATQNIRTWKHHPRVQTLAPIHLHHADATKHPLPKTPTLAYLFHPFEASVLRRFLAHVDRHLQRTPHAFDLMYVNAEHGSLLDKHPALTLVYSGNVAMTAADHVADLAEIAQQKEYGSTGDELCKIYRYSPIGKKVLKPGK